MGKQRELDSNNPLIQQLITGGQSDNPKYNPKKKVAKGKQPEPRYIYDKSPKPVGGGVWDRYADAAQKIQYDNTDLGLSIEEYDAYTARGANPGPYKTIDDLNRIRAENQSALEQTGYAVTQAVGNEVILGTVLGLSNLVDMAVNIATDEGADDYTNPFSLQLEQAQEAMRERFEIYREDPNATWAIDDFGWWADNAVSIASTASMLIPSIGVTKGLGALGKLAKADRVTYGIAKAARGAGLTNNSGRLAKAMNSGAEIGTSALLSRTMEGYLEARGVYTETYDKSLARLQEMSDEDKTKLIENNPEFVDKTDEEIASHMSSLSADETFKNDYAMLLFDVAQFKALGSMWKGVSNKTTTSALRQANRNATASLSNETSDAIKSLGFIGKRREAIQHALKNPLSSLSVIQLSEGLEEGYQGIQTEKGKEVAELIFDPTFNTRSLESYLKDPAIWEQAFWGVLGGVGFQAIGSGLGNLSNKIKGKINEKNLTEQEYALSQMTDEKIREAEINSRKARMQQYAEGIQLLNANKNPFGYKVDPVTKQPIIEDGSHVNEDVTPEEAEELKARLTNGFVTNMTLDAIDKGNFDLLKEFVSDTNFNKFFEEAGVDVSNDNKQLSQILFDKMNDVNEYYSSTLYDILNSIDVENENVAKIVSRDITRRKLEFNDLNESSVNLSNIIAENSDDLTITSNYEEAQRAEYVKDKLTQLDKSVNELQILLNNRKISEQAYNEAIKENNQRRNQLLDYAAANTGFGNVESIKDLLKETLGNRNANALGVEFDRFLEENKNILSVTDTDNTSAKPKKSVQEMVKKLVELEDTADYIGSTIPSTQTEYQREYDNISKNVDRITMERFNKAVADVGEYLENAEDIRVAHENIMTNNVDAELKKQLDILMLGHHSTKRYSDEINAIINTILKNKRDEAIEAAKVNIDGNQTTPTNANKEREEIGNVIAETDGEDTSMGSSSTGKPPATTTGTSTTSTTNDSTPTQNTPINPNEPIIGDEDLTDAIQTLDKASEEVLRKREEELILDTDARAVGLASSITFNLFKSSRNLFDNLEGKDVKSEEFSKLVDIVADELFTQGVSRGYTRSAAIDGIKLSLNAIHRRLNAKGVSGADNFKRLADEITTRQKIERDEDGKASTTRLIPDNEFDQIVDEFINSYAEERGVYKAKGSKTIINIEDLFREILNNDGITYEQAKHIFFNIADYIRANNNKYIFTNKTELNRNLKTPNIFFNNLINSKSTTELVDTYMHIATPSKLPVGYNKAISEAAKGLPVDIGYYEGEFGTSDNSISIKRNGVEIGYLGSVVPNSTNTGYTLKRQNQGFVYNVSDNNGLIESNLDDLFIPLINRETEDMSNLMDIAYKQKAFETAIANGQNSQAIDNDDVSKVLNNPTIKALITKGDIKIPDFKVTDKQKAQYILSNINNIIFYDDTAVTADSILTSYEYWKSSTYDNYVNTHKIQQALKDNKKITTKMVGMASGKVLIDDTNHDVSDMGFTHEENPIMIVDANGNIINEKTNTTYNNVAGFEPGTMGVLLRDNPNAPIIALFTEANLLSNNNDLANDTYKELVNLLTAYQTPEGNEGKISFNTLADALSDLFSGPGVKSNNLFSGYNVIKTNDSIALNIQGQKGMYNLIIHKFQKGTNIEGTGITYIPNGDKSKSTSSINANKSLINTIAKEIVANLSFNRTFYAINNKNVENDNNNKYLYKEDGKLVVDVGGRKSTYNSFGHFVLKNNAFKTNQGVDSNGNYFDSSDNIKSLYINTAIITSPVEEDTNTQPDSTAADLIKTATKTKSVNTSTLLNKAGVPLDKTEVLTGNNEFGIEIIPKEVYFDNRATKADAYYSKGKIFFTNRGANSTKSSPNNLVRLLIHENLHAKFEEHSLFQRDGLVDDLFNTYDALVEAVNNDVATLDKTSTRYKEAFAIQKWLADNKFNVNEYFDNLSVAKQRQWANRTEDEKRLRFAEEWLVESLTQPSLTRYLNSTEFRGEEINVEGIDNKDKTIWQKIIDVLLKLFGKNTSNIENNTILAKQYAILGDNTSRDTTNDVVATKDEVINDKTDEAGESPTSTEVTDDNVVEKVDKVKKVEDSHTAGVKKRRERRERFSTTSNLNDFTNTDEVLLNSYNNTGDVNTNGIKTVPNMNDYINTFAEQDKPIVAKMIASNQLKFACE